MVVFSKVDIPFDQVNAKEVAKQVEKMLVDHKGAKGDVILRIALTKNSWIRRNKYAAHYDLKLLIEEDGTPEWINGAYNFNFAAREYHWKQDKIYLTVGDQLMLYKKLVLGTHDADFSKAFYRMRGRLGEDFLMGYI
jgi:hypothetical protein